MFQPAMLDYQGAFKGQQKNIQQLMRTITNWAVLVNGCCHDFLWTRNFITATCRGKMTLETDEGGEEHDREIVPMSHKHSQHSESCGSWWIILQLTWHHRSWQPRISPWDPRSLDLAPGVKGGILRRDVFATGIHTTFLLESASS